MLRRNIYFLTWGLVVILIITTISGCHRSPGEILPPVTRPKNKESSTPTIEEHTPTPTQVLDTPTPAPTRPPPESTAVYYTVRYGDTLSRIATVFGTTTEALMRLNGMRNADQLAAGQVLQISLEAQYIGPSARLIPDSELVYGPAYADFDIVQAVTPLHGIFKDYVEEVEGQGMTGPAIVQRVAEQYSVGPRVLLALLELRSGWLTNPNPPDESYLYPLGYDQLDYTKGLYHQLIIAADALNIGFYGWQLDTLWLVQLDNGVHVRFSTQLNAGTAGLQRALAGSASDYEVWTDDLRLFDSIYQRLFGNAFQYTVEPLIPDGVQAPILELPWSEGETWHFTGGPHPGWGTQGAWSALDFTTNERNIGCLTSQRWVTAAAPGQIITSKNGMVLQDLDNDGFSGTGWVLLYMHVAADGRVNEGTTLAVGERIGHPSCEGGVSNATHLHFARRYNGIWIPADDAQWPMILSGWQAQTTEDMYDGALIKDGQTRTAWENWEAGNAIRH